MNPRLLFLALPVLLLSCKTPQGSESGTKDVDRVDFGGTDASGTKQCVVRCAEGCVNDDAEQADRKTMPCSQALDPALETKWCTKSISGRKCTPNGTPGTNTGNTGTGNGGGTTPPPTGGGGSSVQPTCDAALPPKVAAFKIVMEASVSQEQFCEAFVPMFDDYLTKRPQIEKLFASGGAAKKPASIAVIGTANVGYDRTTFHKLEIFWNVNQIKAQVDTAIGASIDAVCGTVAANQWCDAFAQPPTLWTYAEAKVKGFSIACADAQSQLVTRAAFGPARTNGIATPDGNARFGAKLRAEPFVWTGETTATNQSSSTGQAPCVENNQITTRVGIKPVDGTNQTFTTRQVLSGQRVKPGLSFTCDPVSGTFDGSDQFPVLCFKPIPQN